MTLEDLIIRFDGTVVELFYKGRGDSCRFRGVQLEQAQLLRLDSRRSPTLDLAGAQNGEVSPTSLKMWPEELGALQAIVDQIDAAIPR